MLRTNYDVSVIGMNYLSLIHSIISLKEDKSVLVIDDSVVPKSNKWFLNIGEIEKSILEKIGKLYEIECLQNIDKFLEPRNTLLIMDDLFIELSDSPFANIKEIARKLPECFGELYSNKLSGVKPEEFDSKFKAFLCSIADKSSESITTEGIESIFNSTDLELAEIYESFLNYLEQDSLTTKQLHYVLQVVYQTVFSSAKEKLESSYLLLSLISPRFSIDSTKLTNELLYEFRKLGGDLKSTTVQDWGIEDNELKYLLLSSIDGLTESRDCFYFGQITSQKKFENQNNQTRFFSIKVQCLIDHEYVEFFKNKRIIFSKKDRMGSDFPFWEVHLDNLGNLTAVYSYADNLGTKASLYYHHALDDIYDSLLGIFPGLKREDWVSRAKVTKGSELWLEYSPKDKAQLNLNNNYRLNKMYLTGEGTPIDRLHYCGVDRAKSMGLYSYILDIFSP